MRVTNLGLDLAVSFESKTVAGTATLALDRLEAGANKLHLDTRDLSIAGVEDANGQPLGWRWGRHDPIRGRELIIDLSVNTRTVTIAYSSDPGAAGLQWLEPRQTASGAPFLFTQSQAIQARSWIPLQDTPGVRFTYQAKVKTVPGLMAVMSASNPVETSEDGYYEFDMPQPIPSYLMALGVGRLEFRPMGERTGVYAEPSVVAAAAEEFSDTEKMMDVGEALYGPYRWGRYDLLILPASFPFGGMENPRLSFITPTVIAGDKSLVALIAHELAHSWSGNLVTNASWDDLWLNEGFTVYFEARIMEAVYGQRREAMEAVLGYQSLVSDFADLSPEDEHLELALASRDPDDAFSQVAYEKGRLFLVWLERQVGREKFDRFLRDYFDEYAFQSLSTDDFIRHLNTTLLSEPSGRLDEAAVREWINGPDLPTDAVLPKSNAFTDVGAQRQRWLAGDVRANQMDTRQWSVHEWLYFLNGIAQPLGEERMQELDAAFSLTQSRNAEIAHSWLRIAIREDYEGAKARLRDYLVTIGRRKLIVPLYEDLAKTDEGRQFARDVFAAARSGYHPLTVSSVAAVLSEGDG